MGLYHIGKKGPAPCGAMPGACPLGGSHFNTFVEANWAFEEAMAPMLFEPQTQEVREFDMDAELAAYDAEKAAEAARKAAPKPYTPIAEEIEFPDFSAFDDPTPDMRNPGSQPNTGERVL